MDFNIEVPGCIVAQGSMVGIDGSDGLGFFRLRFLVDLLGSRDAVEKDISLVELCADVHLGNKLFGRARSRSTDLPTRLPPGAMRQIALEMDASPWQMEALERLRDGGDLTFTLWLSGSTASPEGLTPLVRAYQPVMQVNRGVWSDLLQRIGYRDALLLEVPLGDLRTDPNYRRAVEALSAAQHLMRTGEYERAVGECRKALEVIKSEASSETEASYSKIAQEIGNRSAREAWTKEERLNAIQAVLRLLTHIPHHAGGPPVSWRRSDAVLALVTLAMLIEQRQAKVSSRQP